MYLKNGLKLYEAGQYPLALGELLKADALDPDNHLIKNNLGLVYFMRERLDLAEQNLRLAVKILPTYTDGRNNLVRILIEAQDYKNAQIELEKVFADLTYNGVDRAYYHQGLIAFNQKQFAAAEKSFSKSIEQRRDSCGAYNYWGRSIFEQGDYARAATALDKAIVFCQKAMVDEPHYYSALAYYRAGDQDRSRTRFEEIVRIYSNGKYQEKSRQMLELIGKAH